MSSDPIDTLENIARVNNHLATEFDEILKGFRGKTPICYEVAGDLSRAIVKFFPIFTRSEKRLLFSTIEQELHSDDEESATLVAVGLIETLANGAVRDGAWGEIRKALGKKSLEHATNWLAF